MAPRSSIPSSLLMSAATLLLFTTLVAAHSSHSSHDSTLDSSDSGNGMDMSMDGAMALDGGHGMMSSLHFRPFGDTLWFLGWVPRSNGAMVGACIGLFLLAMGERWVASVRAGCERAWRVRSQQILAARTRRGGQAVVDKGDDEKQKTSARGGIRDVLALRTVPPFIPSQDIARGVLHAVQAAIGYALMLAVMTFQAAFIISIVVGLGVGETLFGRFIAAAGAGATSGVH